MIYLGGVFACMEYQKNICVSGSFTAFVAIKMMVFFRGAVYSARIFAHPPRAYG